MKKIKNLILCLSCLMLCIGNVNGDTYQADKKELPYEITSIVKDSSGFTIKGWALFSETQHFSRFTHSYQLRLNSGDHLLKYNSSPKYNDQTDIMRYKGVRICNVKEYNRNAKTCYYSLDYTGFEFKIPYSDLKMGRSYTLTLDVDGIKSRRINLYYPSVVPITARVNDYEYKAISSLNDTKLKVINDSVFVRPYAGSTREVYHDGPYCSYSFLNTLYYANNSVYNRVYEKRVINNNTYYRVASSPSVCIDGHKTVQEGNKYINSWIPSSYVDYSGTPLQIKTRIINTPPILTIKKHPVIYDDQTLNPFDYVSAHDNEEGNLTPRIKLIAGELKKASGIYHLTFSVSDKYGATDKKTMDITVNERLNSTPVITAHDKTIYKYEAFNPLKEVNATDKEDGNLKHKISYSGNVNSDIIGTYPITYYVKDSKGKEATKHININVVTNPRCMIRFIDLNRIFYKEKTPGNWTELIDYLEDQKSSINEPLYKSTL
ncbi:MAG: DUF5011 domain-containing protein [Erysipelotrichaceae bacterium]